MKNLKEKLIKKIKKNLEDYHNSLSLSIVEDIRVLFSKREYYLNNIIDGVLELEKFKKLSRKTMLWIKMTKDFAIKQKNECFSLID